MIGKRGMVVLLGGLFLIFSVCYALARDPTGKYANAPYHEWYKEQYNAHGQWCCDKSDGHDYYGTVTFNADGSVTLDGGHTLPAYMVLKGPNPTGHAVWWYVSNEFGHRDYCFAPGSMG